MSRLKLTKAAERDLEEIWLYIARDSVAYADAYIDKVLSRCALLAEHPESGRVRDDVAKGLCAIPVESHIIFYRVKRKHVVISRVLHSARDIRRLF